MARLCIFLSLINLISCSSISFSSNQKSSLSFDLREGQSKEVSYEVRKPFFMWGLVPENQVVSIDDRFNEEGFNNVSDINIKEIETKTKVAWMLLTLGMYYPVTYTISGRVN